MKILNALDLKKGAKVDKQKFKTLSQPLQFLPNSEKDSEWGEWNLDWLEWQGLKRIAVNGKKYLKNYKLAAGIIDKADYIPEESDPDYKDILDTLMDPENDTPYDLKFYSIIPNVVNTLVNEFSKRNSNIKFRAIDDASHSELLEEKRKLVFDSLLSNVEQPLLQMLGEQGADVSAQETQEEVRKQAMSLPEVQEFIDKKYELQVEQWANHQTNVDSHRFNIEELEEKAFRDSLTTNTCLFHFPMYEDDYDMELWNPVTSWYIKSPEETYISKGHAVGKTELITLNEAIDKYGRYMTADQVESLESTVTAMQGGYNDLGLRNDGDFYDPSMSHEWNVEKHSLGMKQFLSDPSNHLEGGTEVLDALFKDSSMPSEYYIQLIRVTTAYWKSYRKYGHLTKIDQVGNVTHEIVTEDYIPENAIYNNSLTNDNNKNNLIHGEHVDWIWVNEVWGGIKLASNASPYLGASSVEGNSESAVYIGIDSKKIRPLKFQFKGDNNLYGCKLPVEGADYSARNMESVSMVDLLKPYQISYNVVTNQINDILIDELGTILLFDQNALPKHSMGEDWGDNNMAKAYGAMKDFQMLPLDTSITNTENPLQFQHYQTLNLEQTNRLIGRIQLANYFKQQAFEAIGVSPQRMGSAIEQETAEGVRAAVNNSYSQTEHYFVRHCDYLMPRVHEMRTNLAQYYHSNKPSLRLQYLTSLGDKVNFQMNSTDLMIRDFNVYATTKVKHEKVLQSLKQLALNNNTSGASIFDLGSILQSDNIAEVQNILKDSERKTQEANQQRAQQEQQMQEQRLEAEKQDRELSRNHEAMEAEKERRKDILVAEIRASGFSAMQDTNQNNRNDFLDNMDDIRKRDEFRETMNLKRDESSNKNDLAKQKLQIDKEKLELEKYKADKEVEVARTNKNKYDK